MTHGHLAFMCICMCAKCNVVSRGQILSGIAQAHGERVWEHRRTKEQDWQREPEVAGGSYRSRVSLATRNLQKVLDTAPPS